MKVFLTGIITTPYAREFLAKCAQALREKGFTCYTPAGGWQGGTDDRAESTVADDFAALQEADALVAIIDGYSIDDAVAAHIGAFHALARLGAPKKGIVGVLHDTRVARWDWAAGARAVNYYIVGCIEERGRVVRSLADAAAELLRWDGRTSEVRSLDAGIA
ncbi:MAG: nucleoside 2-deoxyribosyltransferase [Armatimonadota bacterium]|nr:nucleoside 2-deoxyribosyltransferase [Armatimonadota bacterium]MDR7486135.1 nucleoside 2-deoxyribosyltransferase [Armatimonadota bacterium]MDR7531766.1 nucleoside 2-deoxyribosyltransferase [Armatimonadota bacterium]MDR7534889.1 nucleoside 2-deoxyribosyltransferase [Armatimonadota bacterium]